MKTLYTFRFKSMSTSMLETKETTRHAVCKCGYQWETRSKMVYVTCPNDRKMVKVASIEGENPRRGIV